MADYDVAAVGLDSPPSEAFKTTYRPAILVENLGIHPADVFGTITILSLDTGLQVFSSAVALATLAAGATKPATATSTWDATVEGYYIAFGYVTTPHDSNPNNNNLPPTTFHVGPGTPPPPVTVPAHAQQHEDGGSDKLEVSGLAGKLADPQDPDEHAASHQLGGADQLSIGGLSGKAAEAQTPITHSNAYHNPTMATSSELSAHQGATSVHSAATNLANRETTGPDTGLVPFTQLATGSKVTPVGDRYLREDRFFHAPMPDGAIITWLATDPIPEGWELYSELPTPTPMTIRIRKLPTPP
jgi:hypothetical protein